MNVSQIPCKWKAGETAASEGRHSPSQKPWLSIANEMSRSKAWFLGSRAADRNADCRPINPRYQGCWLWIKNRMQGNNHKQENQCFINLFRGFGWMADKLGLNSVRLEAAFFRKAAGVRVGLQNRPLFVFAACFAIKYFQFFLSWFN